MSRNVVEKEGSGGGRGSWPLVRGGGDPHEKMSKGNNDSTLHFDGLDL